ncbi:MAG: sigma 54-interacting transcriptional regulator [Nitrospirae bacterium]|nr:sigma 54-interacting transcriptional regulator [Nitrospirota bacterium]
MDRSSLELSAIYEISKILGSSLEITKTLKNALKVLSVFLDIERAAISLKENGQLVIKAAHGLSADEIKSGRYLPSSDIEANVAKSGYPVVIPNAVDDSQHTEKKAFLCVPMKSKKEIIGVLSAYRIYRGFTKVSLDEDLRLLKIIASLITQWTELSEKVETEKQTLIQERESLKLELKGKYRIDNVIGSSGAMQDVFEAVHRVAKTKATVLITGESGTGKELIARAIHYMGKQSNGAFIKFNCASIPEGLLEAELFGHDKGAFTGAMTARRGRFELAHKGTIFLDEIGDLSMALQPKILRILQEREFERIGSEKTIKVDVRVIAATSKNLQLLVSQNSFREDLYYRLNVVPICLPPMRERTEDITELIEYFLKKFSKENDRAVELSDEALNLMKQYHWPGNVRELENTVERIVIMSPEDMVRVKHLPLNIRVFNQAAVANKTTLSLTETERNKITEALENAGWVHARAADLLGITPRQIGYKVKKYGIRRKDIS